MPNRKTCNANGEKFISSSYGIDSDNSYVLRKMLVRGASEAYYRYRLYEDDAAVKFKRMFYQFEDLINDLDRMLDDQDGVNAEHRIALIRAVHDWQQLLALDQAETAADYRNLMIWLTREVCPDCQRAMVGA